MNYQRAWAEINLAHLSHNLAALKKRLNPYVKLMGIVKADGYGHGAVPVAKTLLNGESPVDSIGVAICEEGVALREAGIDSPILVMGFTPKELLPYIVRMNLVQTVFSLEGVNCLAKEAEKCGIRASVHIKIDTGMSRLGFLPNEKSLQEICEIAANPYIYIAGIYTHCATSDELDNTFLFEQQRRFFWVLEELKKRGLNIPTKHMANSGVYSQFLRGVSQTDFGIDTVRLGILLYGHPPSAEMAETCKELGLKPVMRLLSQVSMVKDLPAGVGVSYGHIYKTERPSKIAVLPVGYADGYPRRLSFGGKVLVNGQFAPIAGAICMDQCMADVTDIPGVKTGDQVVMLGNFEEGISADCLAEVVGTISYEILCGIGKRIPRVYV